MIELAIPTGGEASVGLSAEACLKCNVCNTVCPVLRVTDRFPGPKYVGPQAQRFRLAVESTPGAAGRPLGASPDLSVDWCSGCGMCTAACPAGVRIAEINNRARAVLRSVERPGPLGWRHRLRDRLLGETDLLGRIGVPLAPLANLALHARLTRGLAQMALGIHRHAALPAFTRRTFARRWQDRHGPLPTTPGPGLPGPERAVVFFHGCAANYYEPHVADAAVAVLERNGFQVIVPPQLCCGLPLISNGRYEVAADRARRNLAVLGGFARAGYRIVGTSTSCTHTLKAEYREMLDLDDADAQAVAGATWDISEFLLRLHEEGRLDTAFGRLEGPLPYHAPCQLRSHGIGLPALDLFALVPGLAAQDLDRDCCGVAGTYGLKEEKYQVAMDVGAPLFADLRASPAVVAACDSETCRWHLQRATGKRMRHPVEVLAEAYAAAAPSPSLPPAGSA
ncbi:MAG: anaerobic glycerol-3-phosphate dehydrogenase subunit C [Candidatus Limnocylindrales bacterium]